MNGRGSPRREILRAIENHPGSHLRALERLLPYSLGALRHHLKQLEAAGLIRVQFDLRYKRYFPITMGPELRAACGALRQRQARRIVVLILSKPGVPTAEVSATLGLARSSLGVYLARLRAANIVERDPTAGGGWRLVSPPTIEAALMAYEASFMDRLVDRALEVFEATDPNAPPAVGARPEGDPAAGLGSDPSEE